MLIVTRAWECRSAAGNTLLVYEHPTVLSAIPRSVPCLVWHCFDAFRRRMVSRILQTMPVHDSHLLRDVLTRVTGFSAVTGIVRELSETGSFTAV